MEAKEYKTKISVEGEKEYIKAINQMAEAVKSFGNEIEKLNEKMEKHIQLLKSTKEIQSQKDTDNEDR